MKLSFALLLCSTLIQSSRDTEQSSADRARQVRAQLRELGVRVSGSYAYPASEAALKRELSGTARLRRTAIKTGKDLQTAEAQMALHQETMLQLTEANVELNSRLANVAAGDVATNNQLVGLINSNNGKLKLLDARLKPMKQELTRIRTRAAQAHEDYASHVLSLAEKVPAAKRDFETMQQDTQVTALLASLSKLTGKQVSFEHARGLDSTLTEISKAHESVSKQPIRLRQEGSARFVRVVVNGKAHEMVLDPESTLVTLPWNVARQLGVTVKPSDSTATAKLSDGTTVRATRVEVEAIRVGTHVARKVPCVVLAPDAAVTHAILGMSFLSRFQYGVSDADLQLSLQPLPEKSLPQDGGKPDPV